MMLPWRVPLCTGMGAVRPAGSVTTVVAPVYMAWITASASQGMPRSYMRASISS